MMGFLMVGMIAVEADAASRVSSSRSSFSSSRSSYSAPKSTYSAPKQQAGTSSNPGLKALGFSKPASTPTVSNRSVSASSKPVAKTTTTSGGWFSQKRVSSTPAYKPPVRKVISPTAYRSQPRNVTVIQRNYYGNSYGGYNGYNRGYGGGYYGNHYGGSGMGTSMLGGALGAFGGMMIYDALTSNNETKHLEAKMNTILANQQIQNQNLSLLEQKVPVQQPQVVPQCFLPQDAPLVMDPKFYCEQPK
jgi:hypothetical protein